MNLVRLQANGGDVFGLSALANTHASIIEHLISHADWFFPGEVLEHLLNGLFDETCCDINKTSFCLFRLIIT